MELIFWIVVFIASLALLIKSSDWFTEAAEKIGLAFGMSPFIVGVTIVAIGTSLPELISSLFAIYVGETAIIAGNIIGSNIANIFLILGVAAVLSKKTIEISHDLIHVDLPLLVSSAFLLVFMLMDGVLDWWEGLLLLFGLCIYLWYSTRAEHEEVEISKREIGRPSSSTYLVIVLSLIGIFLGAKYTIDSVLAIAEMIHIGAEILALSAVALGTSLPELAVTVSAARAGKSEMAIGNILGSNIFNTFAIMGVSGVLAPIIVTETLLTFALPVMVGATLLYFFMTQDKRLTKFEGYMLILFYIFFIIKSFF